MKRERDAIVDAAIAMAERDGWEQVRLYRVAESLDMPLAAIGRHFREKEELVEAWFDRADAALLKAAGEPMLAGMPTVDRLEHLVFTWLAVLAPHRRVTAQMIRGKLEPGHLHVQIPAVLRISRTVQWLREAGGRDAAGIYRGLEETVLTSIFVSTFVIWLRDDSPDHDRARRWLRARLGQAAGLSRWVPGFTGHRRDRAALPGPAGAPVDDRAAAAQQRG